MLAGRQRHAATCRTSNRSVMHEALSRRGRIGALLVAASLLLAGAVGVLRTTSAQALENGVARTPPMGWNSWNTSFHPRGAVRHGPRVR
ncbi:hypothetical protein AB0J72_56125 [Dactylosporangium sp. NPDC049742]|uniref:hypothetical protein n=1 Tax=Dactylosporangium sp. NPDC049742 TaxID=3154737 RepID=UPI003449F799